MESYIIRQICGSQTVDCSHLPTPDFSTLKMEAISSSETSVYTISARRHIPEDGILYSHRRENLNYYIS
jgi:hypothetical protein